MIGLPGNPSPDCPQQRGCPTSNGSKKQLLYAVVLASRHQMSSWLWSGERLLQEPAPDPARTEAAHHGGGHVSPWRQWSVSEGVKEI